MKREGKRGRIRKKREIGKRAQEGACVPTRKTFEKNWRESTEIERWQRVRLLGKYVAKEMEAKDSENTREERLWLRQSKLRGKAENMSVERERCVLYVPHSSQQSVSLLCPLSIFLILSMIWLIASCMMEWKWDENDENGEVNKARKGDETKANENRWKLGSISNSAWRATPYGEIELAYSWSITPQILIGQ